MVLTARCVVTGLGGGAPAPTTIDPAETQRKIAEAMDRLDRTYTWSDPAADVAVADLQLAVDETFDDNAAGWGVGTTSGRAGAVTSVEHGALTSTAKSGDGLQVTAVPGVIDAEQLGIEITGQAAPGPEGDREVVGTACRSTGSDETRVYVTSDGQWIWERFDDRFTSPRARAADGGSGDLKPLADGAMSHTVQLICASYENSTKQHVKVTIDGEVVADRVAELTAATGGAMVSFQPIVLTGGSAEGTATVEAVKVWKPA